MALAISIGVHFTLTKAGMLNFPDVYAIPPHDLFSAKTITANVFGIFPFLGRVGLTGDAGYTFVRFAWAIMIEVIFYLAAFGCFVASTLLPNLRTIIFGSAVAGALAMHVVHDYWRPIFEALTFAPYFTLGVCLYGILAGLRIATVGAAISFALTNSNS